MKAILKTLATVVGVPTLVASLYFGLLASDLYVSEAKFAVRSAKGAASTSGIGALLATSALSGGQDSPVVVDYTGSLDMLQDLKRRVNFVEHYSDESADWLSRLDPEANQEELVEYFHKRVAIEHDLISDVMTIRVQAFDPEMAQSMATAIIELNEQLVNRLSNRMEQDALRSAREEMELAAQRVRATAQDINRFQTRSDSLSPSDESVALFERISAIEARLSETRAELGETLSFMREDTADAVTLKNRINALERQLALERGRVTGDSEGNLGSLVESYQPLVVEREIAQNQYASALSAFELARVEAQRKKQYLITFVEPSYPDAATEPKRLVKIITVMLFSFLAYLIGGLLWSALKDHIGH